MPSVDIGRIRFYYESTGAGEPLLMLHGFTGSSENWRDVAGLLADRFNIFTVDLPGHGQTSAPDDVNSYTLTATSDGLARLIETVLGQPAYVLGYSMGGRVALHLGINHPAVVRALVLESASPGLDSAEERAARIASDEALAERIERGGVPAFVEAWEGLPLWASQRALPPAAQERLHLQRLRNSARGLALSLRGMGAGVQPSLWSQLADIRCPTWLIAGALDAKFVAINQRMAELIPGARLCILPDAGHAAHLEQPGAFSAIVRGIG
jgi:2-succinyl-6-hydroxy-2,4-cyclohexadiene-1-carboxylate synthase